MWDRRRGGGRGLRIRNSARAAFSAVVLAKARTHTAESIDGGAGRTERRFFAKPPLVAMGPGFRQDDAGRGLSGRLRHRDPAAIPAAIDTDRQAQNDRDTDHGQDPDVLADMSMVV